MIGEIAPMYTSIVVGFGDAVIKRDGVVHLDCEEHYDKTHSPITLSDAEKIASEDPDHKWEAVIYGPLYGVTFERRGPDKWIVTEENEGFA